MHRYDAEISFYGMRFLGEPLQPREFRALLDEYVGG